LYDIKMKKNNNKKVRGKPPLSTFGGLALHFSSGSFHQLAMSIFRPFKERLAGVGDQPGIDHERAAQGSDLISLIVSGFTVMRARVRAIFREKAGDRRS
jgi:hypothetical protein